MRPNAIRSSEEYAAHYPASATCPLCEGSGYVPAAHASYAGQECHICDTSGVVEDLDGAIRDMQEYLHEVG